MLANSGVQQNIQDCTWSSSMKLIVLVLLVVTASHAQGGVAVGSFASGDRLDLIAIRENIHLPDVTRGLMDLGHGMSRKEMRETLDIFNEALTHAARAFPRSGSSLSGKSLLMSDTQMQRDDQTRADSATNLAGNAALPPSASRTLQVTAEIPDGSCDSFGIWTLCRYTDELIIYTDSGTEERGIGLPTSNGWMSLSLGRALYTLYPVGRIDAGTWLAGDLDNSRSATATNRLPDGDYRVDRWRISIQGDSLEVAYGVLDTPLIQIGRDIEGRIDFDVQL